MSQTQTVTINGKLYNALTGLPVVESTALPASDEPKPATFAEARVRTQGASKMHSSMQRSKTLNRTHTKKPEMAQQVVAAQVAPTIATTPIAVRPTRPVVKSPAITKFAPHPQVAPRQHARMASSPAQKPAATTRQHLDIAPVKHPAAARAQQIQAQKAAQQATAKKPVIAPVAPVVTKPAAKPVHTPSQVIKNNAIEQALTSAPTKKEQKAPKKRSFFARHPRMLSIGSASLALIMLGGYFTYLNMPNLSVRVAATQAGIDAKYPDYQPDGYRLNGPVAAESGKVQMKFASNAGPQNFAITQEKSAWDSSAVMNNLVKPASNDSYVTTNERGLTIYTYDGNAAWVNGGILYTIQGDAPLSSEQIRRIATSL